jgi:hypothetical protein
MALGATARQVRWPSRGAPAYNSRPAFTIGIGGALALSRFHHRGARRADTATRLDPVVALRFE